MEFLRRLGARMRARRLKLGRTRLIVARGAEISVTQLVAYESGQGHPPAATLHRLALVLGTSSSTLLGETDMRDDSAEHYDSLVKLYADPAVGAVVRHMQDMAPEDKKALQSIAAAIKNRARTVETVEVMK